MSDELFSKALDLAYFYLKFRPRSKKEVVDYLNKKTKKYHFSQTIITEVIKQLEEEELINDKKFIAWFVDQRNRAKPKSQYVLSTELYRYGIDKDLINYHFQDSPQDEDSLARQALEKKWRQFSPYPKDKRFQKAASFLSRRGFSFEIIKKTIDQMEN